MYKKNIYRQFLLNYTKLTEKTMVEGKDEFPVLPSYITLLPDYLCLYKDKKDYQKTEKTCVCFYEYDNEFDGIKGLFNAIYYDDEKRLNYFKNRFKGVKMIVEPDYSQVRDIELIENKYRQFKARVVGLWFLLEMNIPVIPNINYFGINSFEYMLDGIKNAETLSISLKGILKRPDEIKLLKKALEFITDYSNVKNLIVYTTGNLDSKINEIFDYPMSKKINIVIPNNSLQHRNRLKQKKKLRANSEPKN